MTRWRDEVERRLGRLDHGDLVSPHNAGWDGYYYPGKMHMVSSGFMTRCGKEVTWNWRRVTSREELERCQRCFRDGFPFPPRGDNSLQPQLPFLPRRPDGVI